MKNSIMYPRRHRSRGSRYAAIACLVGLLCAWGGSAPAADESQQRFRAGAAAVDITPKTGVSLDGPISKNGPARGVADPLYARALVFDDGKRRLAIVVCDLCVIGRDVCDRAKTLVQREMNLPASRILISATHTHSAPRAVHIGTGALDVEYHDQLSRRIADAVVRAVNNLAPAKVGWTSFDKPEFVRCRRSLCEPGSVAANPFGQTGERIKSVAGKSTSIIRPAGPVDPQVSLLSVQHDDGTPLALLANFSVHYAGGTGRGIVSADYFGAFAASVERQLAHNAAHLDAAHLDAKHPDVVAIMSNGTSGNTFRIPNPQTTRATSEWMTRSGQMLADEAVRRIKTIEHRTPHSLAVQETELRLHVRRPSESRLAWAEMVLRDRKRPHPHSWTPVYAAEAQHLSRFPETVTLKLQAIRIGELGIAAIPCEVFAETGLAIKKQSPHADTFTIELANGYAGYLPPPAQHALGGYETWPARSSFLETEAEPKILAETLRLLRAVVDAGR